MEEEFYVEIETFEFRDVADWCSDAIGPLGVEWKAKMVMTSRPKHRQYSDVWVFSFREKEAQAFFYIRWNEKILSI